MCCDWIGLGFELAIPAVIFFLENLVYPIDLSHADDEGQFLSI